MNFLENQQNTINLYGSKAVGEPPLLLGVSVWTAVKHALSFVSQPPICLGEDKGTGEQRTRLNLPATNEEVMRCLAAPAKQDAVVGDRQSSVVGAIS